MPAEPKPFLVAAVTGRALAASAVRGGHRVVVLDCFADRDTRALAHDCRCAVSARRLALDPRLLLAHAAALAPATRCAGLVYGSGFEGRTRLLSRLASGRHLLGNAPAVVAAVKDPARIFPTFDRLGIRHPEVRSRLPRTPRGWLAKEPGSAGGSGVRMASRSPVSRRTYFQRFEAGRRLSVLFLADGFRACVLGFNEQWIASARPGFPFLYGGAVGGVALPGAVKAEIRARLSALVERTGLVGLNGLDFLLHESEWLALEVNPRPTATLDLYDADYPEGLFDWHLRACGGELPLRLARPRAVRAHAVVYAGTFGRVGGAFPDAEWCRDVPHQGAPLTPGDPVCTVHAAAADTERALALLRRRCDQVQRSITEATA
jgi:predicted ATP-grasp superfamily ATP-dependent carboligase